jgi:hypothetical protein
MLSQLSNCILTPYIGSSMYYLPRYLHRQLGQLYPETTKQPDSLINNVSLPSVGEGATVTSVYKFSPILAPAASMQPLSICILASY